MRAIMKITAGVALLTVALGFEGVGSVWADARGYADLGQQREMTTATLMNIASISKTVTASSLMLLVERGQLELDRDVNAYLPFEVRHPEFPGIAITMRQLLTHTYSS